MTKARSLSDFIESDGSVTLVDNQKIKVGTGNDLEIYHDSSHSYIKDGGTGNLLVQATHLVLENAAGDKNYLQGVDGDAVSLYYDGSTKLATTSSGITVTGNISNASGSMTIDVASQIVLDADGGLIQLKDGGTEFAQLKNSSGDLQIISIQDDKDIIFRGSDAGTYFNSLTLDMSEAGSAAFNSTASFNGAIAVGQSTFSGGSILADFHGSGSGVGAQLAFANDHNTDKFYVGIEGNTTGDAFLYQQEDADINFYTNNAFAAKLDNSGNFGLAKSSLATWSSGYNALQVGGRGFVGAHSGSDLYVGQNASYDSGWKYEASVAASLTQHSGGKITHFTAPAGTAGNAISWNTAMDIQPSGKIGIGGINAPFTNLHVHSEGAPDTSGNMTSGIVVSDGVGGNAIKLSVHNSGALNYLQSGYVNNSDVGRDFAVFRGAVETMRVHADGVQVTGTGGTRLKVENTDTNWAALDIKSGGNQANYIFFNDDSAERARIQVTDGGDVAFSAGSSPSETIRIRAAGGITFGGQTAAAHALDDYEEGAFQPSMANTGLSTAPTAAGYYCKIGGVVYVSFYFSGISPTNAGNTRINGMPFTASVPGNAYSVCHYTHGTILGNNNNGGGYFTGTSIDVISPGSTGYNSWATGGNKYGMWSGFYFTTQ